MKVQVKKVLPLGWGMELCRCSSCVWCLRSLLNLEGILTLSLFLLSDGSLMQMCSVSILQWCRMLLSQSINVKSFSSAFGCFVEMWWFLMPLVVWFLQFDTLSFRYLLVLKHPEEPLKGPPREALLPPLLLPQVSRTGG